MSDTLPSTSERPYESAEELRRTSAHLIEEVDRRLGHDSRPEREAAVLRSLGQDIGEFLGRASETGALVEDIPDRTSCQVLLDYWSSTLSHLGLPVDRRRLVPFDAAKLPELNDAACPFVGLEAFRTRTFFFGRERAVENLLERIAHNPLVIVQGASGSGKSSLVLAGAVPILADEQRLPHFRVVGPIAPGDAVLENLMAAVAAATGTNIALDAEVAAIRADSGRLVAMLGQPAALIVIDQFEEVFTLCSDADRTAVAAALVAVLQSRPDHRVVLTLREEFGAELNTIAPLSSYLDQTQHARFSMQEWRMGRAELKAAIERPAALVNLQFAPGVVDEMVDKVVGLDTALPLLQFTLRALWDQRDRNRITRDIYEGVGSPLTALTQFADRFYDAQPFEDQQEAQRLLLEVVTIGRMFEAYRQPQFKSRLLERGNPRTERVLALLADSDFVRITPTRSGVDATVEVKHEALLRNWPRYVDWINEKRERTRRRVALTEAAERWRSEGRSPSNGLLSEWQLRETEQLADLSVIEREYLQVSADAIERTRLKTIRRERRAFLARILVGAAALAVVVAAGAVWRSRLLRGVSNVETTIARAKEASYHGKINLALMQARQAIAEMRSLDDKFLSGRILGSLRDQARGHARDMLLTTLHNANDLSRVIVTDSPTVSAVALHPTRTDGLLAYAGKDGYTHLVALTTGSARFRSLRTCGDALVTALAFDSRGQRLAAGCGDGTVAVWSAEDSPDRWRELGKTRVFQTRTWALDFSPTEALIAVAGDPPGNEHDLSIITLTREGAPAGHIRVSGERPAGGVWSLAFAPDGRALLAGDGEGGVLACKPAGQTGLDAWNCASPESYPRPPRATTDAPAADAIRALVYSPDGTEVAVGHWRGDVDVLDAKLARKRSIDVSQPGALFSLAYFNACGRRYLAIAKAKGILYRLADPNAPPAPAVNCSPPLPATVGDETYSLAFDRRSGRLAAGTGGGYVAVLEPSSGQLPPGMQRFNIAEAMQPMRGAVVSEDGGTARIAVALKLAKSDGANIALLTLRNGQQELATPVEQYRLATGNIRRLSSSASAGRFATLACDSDNQNRACDHSRVAVWSIRDLTKPLLSRSDFGARDPKRIALRPDGQVLLISFGKGGQLLSVPVGSAEPAAPIDSGLQSVREIAFSGDGDYFAAAGLASAGSAENGADAAQVWRLNGARLDSRTRFGLSALTDKASGVSFAADRSKRPLLLVGGESGAIDLFDVERKERLTTFRGDSRAVYLIAFSPAVAAVAAVDSKNGVRLWDTSMWQATDLKRSPPPSGLELTADNEPVETPGLLEFGQSGGFLVGGANALRLWNLDIDYLVHHVEAMLDEPHKPDAGRAMQR
jgi:WD40 repeat protein